ncbi:pyruvate kinase [Rhizobium ruizarguesonis]|uniref:pyruvate kinase n=1 Tax=Rhizobium ruizarguesonis TaxID=2081791 RepID=UPI00102FFCE5|nr:pyruvate kinase [Rhizobium ruizarguesonis]TAY73157.1 pyruvate kinase [Rhizobium ruizarguesonis]
MTADDVQQTDGARQTEPAALYDRLAAIRADIVEKGEARKAELTSGGTLPDRHAASLANLCQYLALRHHDVRPLQRELMALGLSSIGRLESRVRPTLDAVLASLAAIGGWAPEFPRPDRDAFFEGEALLEAATDALFGPAREHRRGRIMVTLPGEAAEDPGFILDLAKKGMDVARINCAHDDEAAWTAMAGHVRRAGEETGRQLTVLMDIAGPKIRTEHVTGNKKLAAGDLIRLLAAGEPYANDAVPCCAVVSLPEIIERLETGHRVSYNDGKLEGEVESVYGGEVLVRVTHTKTGGSKLKAEKGLNFPDTDLGLSPLTAKDRTDLGVVAEHADMLGYSFVTRPDDLDLLEKALAERPARLRPLAFIAKIEQPDALSNLPGLIARARLFDRPFGVMIARGDLAAEIGFERLAEMQEELLWVCEAAGVPTIWATQVLEDLVKSGLPSRGEMTDAAMATRAECVMLNKGPAVADAVVLLDSLLGRMDQHVFKKTPILRPLHTW